MLASSLPSNDKGKLCILETSDNNEEEWREQYGFMEKELPENTLESSIDAYLLSGNFTQSTEHSIQ